jgi:hypothetical protein
VLPLASTHRDGTVSPGGHPPRAQDGGAAGEGVGAVVGEDGKWFQAQDERYLLPLFSNATASHAFHARCAQRRSTHNLSTSGGGSEGSVGPSVAGSDDKADVAGVKTRTQWSWGATRATVVGAHRDEAREYQYSASAEQGDSGGEAGARIGESGVVVEWQRGAAGGALRYDVSCCVLVDLVRS